MTVLNSKEEILIVEDEHDLRESIKEILLLKDYNVYEASSVQQALQKLNTIKPDLIISDILMPGDSGHNLLKKVKTIPGLFNIPFIFLTAQSNVTQIRDGMNLGADDYLTKPFRREDLLNSVKVRLQKKANLDSKLELISNGISKYLPHELRTPLVAIQGYPEFILENFDSLDKTEILEIMDNIKFASKRMQATLEKFMVFSDLSSQSLITIENKIFKTTDVENKIQQIIYDLSEKKYGEREIKISIEEAEIKISENHFSILIRELLENAIKFSEELSEIKISGSIIENKYVLEILDHGGGLTKENLNKVGPFIQFNRDENQQSGNGLGLSIVMKILEIYNSNLVFDTNAGVGTHISFNLDLIE